MTWEPDDAELTWRKRPLRAPGNEDPAHMSGQLYDAMRKFFQEEDWKCVEMEGQSALKLACTGENGEWTCYAQIKENPGRFLFYSVLTAKALESKRAGVAEFIIRANYGMVLGNFEMDYADGEIRYKTSAYLEEIAPPRDFFHTLIYTNLLMTDKYLPGIMSVIYAGMPAEQAIGLVGG